MHRVIGLYESPKLYIIGLREREREREREINKIKKSLFAFRRTSCSYYYSSESFIITYSTVCI